MIVLSSPLPTVAASIAMRPRDDSMTSTNTLTIRHRADDPSPLRAVIQPHRQL